MLRTATVTAIDNEDEKPIQVGARLDPRLVREFTSVRAKHGVELRDILLDFVQKYVLLDGNYLITRPGGSEEAVSLTGCGLSQSEANEFSALARKRGYKRPEQLLRELVRTELGPERRTSSSSQGELDPDKRELLRFTEDLLKSPQNAVEQNLPSLLRSLLDNRVAKRKR